MKASLPSKLPASRSLDALIPRLCLQSDGRHEYRTCSYWIELGEDPIDREDLENLSLTRRSTIAASRPITSTANHLRTNWVQYDVPGQLQQMSLLFDKDCLEAALKKMADLFVMTIKALCGDTPVWKHLCVETPLRSCIPRDWLSAGVSIRKQ